MPASWLLNATMNCQLPWLALQALLASGMLSNCACKTLHYFVSYAWPGCLYLSVDM